LLDLRVDGAALVGGAVDLAQFHSVFLLVLDPGPDVLLVVEHPVLALEPDRGEDPGVGSLLNSLSLVVEDRSEGVFVYFREAGGMDDPDPVHHLLDVTENIFVDLDPAVVLTRILELVEIHAGLATRE